VPFAQDIGIEIDQPLQGGLVVGGVRQQARMQRSVDILADFPIQLRQALQLQGEGAGFGRCRQACRL
jgi:hypothetical protein